LKGILLSSYIITCIISLTLTNTDVLL